MKTKILMLIALICIVAVALPAFGQSGKGGRKRGERRQMMQRSQFRHGDNIMQRLKELRNMALKEEVGLSDKKLGLVIAVLDKYDLKNKEIHKKIRSSNLRLEALVLDNEKSAAKYKKIISAIIKSQKQMFENKAKEMDEVRKVLTPQEQAKFILSLRDVRRKFRHKMRGGKWGTGPDFPEAQFPPHPPPFPGAPGGE